jgi:hypothetical protein
MDGIRSPELGTESFVENIEAKNAEKVKELFELTPEEKESLKEKIENSDGLVRVFVHPYYVLPRQGDEEFLIEKTGKIDNALKVMAFTETENTPPAFVMEEYDKIDRLASLIATDKNGEPEKIRNEIYAIPTIKGDSAPVVDFKPMQTVPHEKVKWANLIKQFEELGVEKILIGGMFLGLPGSEPSACVGHAINHLKNDFNMELSNLTYDYRSGTPFYEKKRQALKKNLKNNRK